MSRTREVLTNKDVSKALREIYVSKHGPIDKRSSASDSEPTLKKSPLQKQRVIVRPLDTKGKRPEASRPVAIQKVDVISASLEVENELLEINHPGGYESVTRGAGHWMSLLEDYESSCETYNRRSFDFVSTLSTTEDESCKIKPDDWKSPIKHQRLRGVCFTLNNYTDKDQQDLRDQYDAGLYTYLVFGREVGKLGTPHLQGYAHFTKQNSFEQIRKIFGRKFHFEYARATGSKFAERYLYCMKDGDFEEFGVRPVHGTNEQKKLKITELIKEGKNQTEIREICPEGYFHHGVKVENWFEDERKINPPKLKTKFYYIERSEDINIYEAIEKLFPNEEFAHIFNLSELISYRNNDGIVKNICYHNPDNISQVESWSYGSKILCKNGYKQLPIYCERMIVYCPWFGLNNKLKKYVKLENLHEDFMLVPLKETREQEDPLDCVQSKGPAQRR
nr:putative replication associated protein [Crucivirus sp.]